MKCSNRKSTFLNNSLKISDYWENVGKLLYVLSKRGPLREVIFNCAVCCSGRIARQQPSTSHKCSGDLNVQQGDTADNYASPVTRCHSSRITHHTLHITHYTLHITHHTSHITHHTSRITHHTSHITHHRPEQCNLIPGSYHL